MLFWIFVILMVIGLLLMFLGCCHYLDALDIIGGGLSMTSFLVALIMLLIIISNNCGVAGAIESNKQRYDSLVYQYENDIYDNDNDLGKRELMADIEKWNTDLAYKKALQNDFWLGIFHPDIYDQFEFIELKKAVE